MRTIALFTHSLATECSSSATMCFPCPVSCCPCVAIAFMLAGTFQQLISSHASISRKRWNSFTSSCISAENCWLIVCTSTPPFSRHINCNIATTMELMEQPHSTHSNTIRRVYFCTTKLLQYPVRMFMNCKLLQFWLNSTIFSGNSILYRNFVQHIS